MTDNMSADEYNAIARYAKEDQPAALAKLRTGKGDTNVLHRHTREHPVPETPEAKTELERWLMVDDRFGPVRKEYVFHAERKWRADFFLPWQGEHGVIIEYDGIMQGLPSHTSLSGIVRDSEKGNEAQAMGIPFYRVNAMSLDDGSAYLFLARVLKEFPSD